MAAPTVDFIQVVDEPATDAPTKPVIERPPNSIQVSTERTAQFYSRIGMRMMMGSEDKPAHDTVEFTGLGAAVNVCVMAASILVQQGHTYEKISTCYHHSERARRRLAKITIVVKKNPEVDMQMPERKEKPVADEAPAPVAVGAS